MSDPPDTSSGAPTTPGISVVICTYNRSRLLAQAVETVLEQRRDPARHEILIVDNNSTDDTRQVSRALCDRHAAVRYLHESNQGLSHARNCGWRAATHEYVGYLDDDAKASPRWLRVAEDIIRDHRPAAFGGGYSPFFESPRPHWFRDTYESSLVAPRAGPLPPGVNQLCGGNMFFRRTVLEQLGGFDPQLGMTGDTLGYGEENDLLRRLREAQPEAIVYYDPALHILHLARSDKLTLQWRARRLFATGRSLARREPPPTTPWTSDVAALGATLLKLAGRMTYRLARRDRKQYPLWQNFAYETGLAYLQNLGLTLERLRRRRRTRQE